MKKWRDTINFERRALINRDEVMNITVQKWDALLSHLYGLGDDLTSHIEEWELPSFHLYGKYRHSLVQQKILECKIFFHHGETWVWKFYFHKLKMLVLDIFFDFWISKIIWEKKHNISKYFLHDRQIFFLFWRVDYDLLYIQLKRVRSHTQVWKNDCVRRFA